MVARARIALAVLAAGLVSIMPPTAARQLTTFQSGDVFLSIGGGSVLIYRFLPETQAYEAVNALGAEDAAEFPTVGSAFDADGNFYVTTFTTGATSGKIYRFARDFDANTQTPIPIETFGNAPESVIVDAAGDLYVGHGRQPGDVITKIRVATDGTATLLATYAAEAEGLFTAGDAPPRTPQGTDWIDLANDQRTLFYTSQGRRIFRFDTATASQLPDFASLAATDDPQCRLEPPPIPCGQLFALRLLPDGGLLVADNIDVKRLDASGTVVQTYDLPFESARLSHNNWFSLNLDPDGQSFWSGDGHDGQIHRFDIATGARTATIDVGAVNAFFGVSIFKELTQATTPPTRCESTVLTVSPVEGSTCGTLTLTAELVCDGQPVAGKTIDFSVKGQPQGQAITDANGIAKVPGVTSPDSSGSTPSAITATFAGDDDYAPASGAGDLTLTNDTTLTVSPIAGDTCGALTLSGTLACGTKSVANKSISFVLDGLAVGAATTNAAGVATLPNVQPPDTAGSFPVTASFAGDGSIETATGTASVTLSSGTVLTVPNVSGDTCGALTLSSTLVCGTKPVADKPISFVLNGLAVGSAPTNASGVATLSNVVPPDAPGTVPLTASFAGDATLAATTGGASATLTNGTTLVVENVSGSTCGTLTLVGTLACGVKSVANLPISFALSAQSVGQATTNASGVATLTNVASPVVPGSFPGAVAVSFAGSPRIAPASDTADLALVNGCFPALALTKTPSPATYSAAGDVITYTYTLTNTGNVLLSSPFTVADDKLGDIACTAAATLAPQAALSCQKTYAIQPADLGGTAATLPKGVKATVNTGPWLQGVLSSQDTSITGAAGLADGIYPGWCIQDHVIVDLHNEPGTLYSTVGATLPADVALLPWAQINYLLNHKIRGAGKTDLDFFKDVQTAVWVLLGEKNPDFGISATARQMINEARANPTFVPGPDDVVAVIIYSDGMGTVPTTIQESIIEVKPFKSITNRAVATARAGTTTVQSNQVEATVRQSLAPTTSGLMDSVAWGHQPAARTTVSTSAFSTTEGDELLLAFVSADYVSGANTRVTGITGAGLAWQLVSRANGQKGTAEIWRAFAHAPLAGQTVTASLSQAVSSAITVVSFKGVDTSGVNGAGAIGAVVSRSGASGAPSATLTATRTGSWVFAAGNDWDRPIARVPVAGQAIVHQYLPPVGDTYWVQRTTRGSVAGSPVTIQDVAPTGDSWNLAVVEVLPAAGASFAPVAVPVASSPKPEADDVVSVDGTGTVTTGAFSTSDGALLLAFAASDGPSNAKQSLTISGAGLSWTLVQRANLQAGTSEIWKAYAPGPLSQVRVSSKPQRGGFDQSLTVVTFRNATGVGGSASAGGPSGGPSAAITATSAGSLVYAVGNDWDRATARVLGPGQQMVHQWVDRSVGDTFWVQAAGAPSPHAGASRRLNATAPTNDRWNLAIVEVVR